MTKRETGETPEETGSDTTADNASSSDSESPVGFEETYSTSEIKIIEKKRNARKEKPAAYRNTVKPRKRKVRTAVLIAGAAALLTGVTLASINMSETPPETGPAETEVIESPSAEEEAFQKASLMLEEIGGAFYYQLSEVYGEGTEQFESIGSAAQEEGTIVEDERGDSYILSGEITNLPTDFDVEQSVEFFQGPLEEELVWTFEDITDSEEVTASLPGGQELIKAIKFHGMSFQDGTPSAVTIVYSSSADGAIQARIDSSVLMMDTGSGADNNDPLLNPESVTDTEDSTKAE